MVKTNTNDKKTTVLECHARTVNKTVLKNVVLSDINELLGDKPRYQEQLQQNIAEAIRSSSTVTDEIDEKLAALQQELLQKANNKESYDAVADEILRL